MSEKPFNLDSSDPNGIIFAKNNLFNQQQNIIYLFIQWIILILLLILFFMFIKAQIRYYKTFRRFSMENILFLLISIQIIFLIVSNVFYTSPAFIYYNYMLQSIIFLLTANYILIGIIEQYEIKGISRKILRFSLLILLSYLIVGGIFALLEINCEYNKYIMSNVIYMDLGFDLIIGLICFIISRFLPHEDLKDVLQDQEDDENEDIFDESLPKRRLKLCLSQQKDLFFKLFIVCAINENVIWFITQKIFNSSDQLICYEGQQYKTTSTLSICILIYSQASIIIEVIFLLQLYYYKPFQFNLIQKTFEEQRDFIIKQQVEEYKFEIENFNEDEANSKKVKLQKS